MKVCIIGCGNMGLIYAQYFTQQHIIKKEDLLLIEKNEVRREELLSKGITTVENPKAADITNAEVVFLAVKPQDFNELIPSLKGRLNKKCIVISIMAGVTIQYLEQSIFADSVVRAMPNAPALYGSGMTVFCCGNKMKREQKGIVTQLLGVTGKTVETEKEEVLDAVTAVSGSGPAYFFYLAQHMIYEATALGIEAGTAELMVKQTLLGAGVMLDKSNKSCAELIKTVASKGGTTEAALSVFEEKKMPEIISQALKNATLRSVELSKR